MAAFAVHMLLAEQHAKKISRDCFAALSRTRASEPLKPKRRRAAISGRSCGASTPCAMPMSERALAFANPCLAACLGLLIALALLREATFPKDKPA